MRTHPVFVLSLLLIAGTAAAQEPQWLKDARAREGQNLKEQAVRSKDGFLTGRIVGRLRSEIVEDAGTYQIEIDIGSETPANCEVLAGGFDLAGMLRATADLTMKQVESVQGKVEKRIVERSDAGVFGSSPYIALDWLYRANDGKAPRVGALKQIVVSKSGHGLYCAHNDVGYTKSFQAAARTLAESLRFEESDTAYFTEVSTATLKGEKIGVAVVTMQRDADGDTKVITSTSLALRVTSDTLQTQDASHVQWVRPDGSLINATHVVTANGEFEAKLELTPTDDGKWLVEGNFKGKALEKVLESTPVPTTPIQEARTRKELFGKKEAVGTQLKVLHWTLADPSRIIESQTTILSVVDADHLAARETLEGVSADLVLERSTGMASKTIMQVGPLSIELERVYVQGTF